MAPGSIAPALVACVLWILVFLQYRESFKGIFSVKPATQACIASQQSPRFVPPDLELSTFNNSQHPLSDWRIL